MSRADSIEEEMTHVQEFRVKEAATAVQLRFELVKHQESLEQWQQERVRCGCEVQGLFPTDRPERFPVLKQLPEWTWPARISSRSLDSLTICDKDCPARWKSRQYAMRHCNGIRSCKKLYSTGIAE